jgi:hypothetical protein
MFYVFSYRLAYSQKIFSHICNKKFDFFPVIPSCCSKVLAGRWPYPVCVNRRLGQEEILNQQEEEEEEGGDQAAQPEEASVSISIIFFFYANISSVLGIRDVLARISTSD